MIKKLELCKPSITSHPDIALPMSIFSTIPYIDNWLCSEFLQIYSNGVYTKRYNYGSCEIYEPLECIRIPHHFDFGADIADFFITAIKNDYYVLVFCDNSQIPAMNTDSPYLHGILLFGFDENAKTFDAIAYKDMKMRQFPISFSEMISAYNSDFALNFNGRGALFNEEDGVIRRINMESQMLVLYKIKQSSYKDRGINLEKVKWHLLDYMESIDTLAREVPNMFDDSFAWGLDVYDEVKEFYRYQSEHHKFISLADPYCIYEHKKDWKSKFLYLNEHSELKCSDGILNDLDTLIKHAEIFTKLIIKYDMKYTGDTSEIINGISRQLDIMKEIEKSTLGGYYEQNRKVFESF